MVDVKPRICSVCGGIEFLKENGYFYCQECQFQCEDICELVFDDDNDIDEDGDILNGSPFTLKKALKKEKPKRRGEDFTSWEMLNFVLRGQVEELLLMGAPPTLKDTILQLWAFYLKKLEIAFFSKDEKVLPKMGLQYNTEDVKILYGLKRKKPVKHTKVSSMNADLNTTISSCMDWSSMQIKKTLKRKAKKALMEKEAELSFMETESNQSSLLDSSLLDDSLSMLSVSMTEADDSFSDSQIQRSEKATKTLTRRNKGNEATMSDPLHLTRFKLVVLLYLALLYEGSKIHVSDLIRWIREGHFSYYEAAKYLPESCFVQGRYNKMFSLNAEFPNYRIFMKTAGDLAKFIKFNSWPIPDASELAKKYVKELHLPEMFSDLILRFIVLVPSSFIFHFGSEIPNYEGRILAILIVILKLLFGLDGKTERRISKAASELNKLMNKKKDAKFNKLFVWQDWVQKLICRDAILSKYHFPTKHALCPDAYGNPYSYINFIKEWNENNAGLLEKYNYLSDDFLRVIQPALMNTFNSILDKLEVPTSSEDQNICFPQCFTPYSHYITIILEKSNKTEKPLIAESAVKVVSQEFSDCDITYLISPTLLEKHVSAYGKVIKFKKKSAQKKFSKVYDEKRKVEVFRYTNKCHVSVLNCSKIKKKELQVSKQESHGKERKGKMKRNKSKRIPDTKCKIKLEKKGKLETKSPKENDAKVNSLLSTMSRKRKKEPLPTKNCKKIKFYKKKFKLYVPCSQYWVRIAGEGMIDTEFETLLFYSFPFSFSWLLAECALISEMSTLTLYKEVLRIENICKRTFK